MTIDRDNQTDALIIATAKGNTPLQVVRWSGARQSVTAGSTSKVIPLPASLEGMEITAIEDVYINFGIDDTVVASSTIASDGSRLFLKGVQVVPVPINPATGVPYTFMAVIRKSTDGIFQVESSSVNVSFPALPAPAGDPDFASVVLLLDFAGADEATDITDLSNSAHVDTFISPAQVDVDKPFLGVNSLLTTGTGAQRLLFGDSADWDFGTGDFTVEVGYRPDGLADNQGIIGNFDNGLSEGWLLQFSFSAPTTLKWYNFSVLLSEDWSPTLDTFVHIAISRSGTDLRVFLDGVQLGSTVTDSSDYSGSGQALVVANIGSFLNQAVDGSVGAVRITKGVARYTANFTPPTEFYPTS